MGARVLYISYDGALEPLGQSQVVAYLCGLAGPGTEITLLSYEKPDDLADDSRVAALRRRLEQHRVRWIPLRYHKRPSLAATLYDVGVGFWRAVRLVRTDTITIVHARSYVAGLIGWMLKRALGTRFVF